MSKKIGASFDFQGNSVTGIPNAVGSTDAVPLAQMTAAIAAVGTGYVGAFNASGGVFPTTGTGPSGAIIQGNSWRITVGGTIGGIVLGIGDLLIATANGATLAADFMATEHNIPAADSTTAGYSRFATQPEASAGNLSTVGLTPSVLAIAVAALGFTRKSAPLIITGDGVTTAFDLTHSWGTLDVQGFLYDDSGTKSDVGFALDRTTAKITFNITPALGVGVVYHGFAIG